MYDFPIYCTWALRVCRKELVPVQTFNSADRYRPYGVTEKFNETAVSTLLYLKERRFLPLIGSGTAKTAQNFKTREKLIPGNAKK